MGINRGSDAPCGPRDGPNTDGLWPTPTTHDQRTNYAQGGMSLGFAARWPTPNTLDGAPPRDPETVAAWNNARDGRTGRKALANLRQAVIDPHYQEKFPTPRAEDSESTGAHRGVPDTLTSYTRARPSPADSFPTPTVYDATGHGSPRAEQKDGSRHAVSLHHLAAEWPTPIASDSHPNGYGGPSLERRVEKGKSISLAMRVKMEDEEPREWATPTAATNRKSRRAMTASTENGRRSGGGQSSPPALEQMVELAEGIIPKELEGIDPANLPPATQALWPTPMAGSNRTSTKAQTGRPTSGPSRGGASFGLEDAVVRAEQWPTPTAADSGGGPGGHREGGDNLRTAIAKDESWPTPRSKDWKGADPARDANRSGLRHSGDDLSTAVDKRSWPTPMAGPVHVQDGGGHGGVKLAEAATEEEVGEDAPRGQLNPDWVEWLMGWPVGWTSKEPLSVENMTAWYDQTVQATWWHREPEGIPRIALGVPNRVSRLKAIGNGQVSLCAAWAALVLFETERQVVEAEQAVVEGPIEVDFFDLVDGA